MSRPQVISLGLVFHSALQDLLVCSDRLSLQSVSSPSRVWSSRPQMVQSPVKQTQLHTATCLCAKAVFATQLQALLRPSHFNGFRCRMRYLGVHQ
jgi:hypothetical protein